MKDGYDKSSSDAGVSEPVTNETLRTVEIKPALYKPFDITKAMEPVEETIKTPSYTAAEKKLLKKVIFAVMPLLCAVQYVQVQFHLVFYFEEKKGVVINKKKFYVCRLLTNLHLTLLGLWESMKIHHLRTINSVCWAQFFLSVFLLIR